MLRFLEPCLLFLLRSGEAHGYKLLSEIGRFGFNPEQLDPSLLYRALREMEAAGWVESHWDAEAAQGPKRRVYALTELGKSQLRRWVEDLESTRDEIDSLLKAYRGKGAAEDGR